MPVSLRSICGLFLLLAGVWSCIPQEEPPRFQNVGLEGDFSRTDTVRALRGTIQSEVGGLQLQFQVFSAQGLDQTARFELQGAIPDPNTSTWGLAQDPHLRLILRGAAPGDYILRLVAVDGLGVRDTASIAFHVQGSTLKYGPWTNAGDRWLAVGNGLVLNSGRILGLGQDDPSGYLASFFLESAQTQSTSGSLHYLNLMTPDWISPKPAFWEQPGRTGVRLRALEEGFLLARSANAVADLYATPPSGNESQLGLAPNMWFSWLEPDSTLAVAQITSLDNDPLLGSCHMQIYTSSPLP